jgi:plastocyanin
MTLHCMTLHSLILFTMIKSVVRVKRFSVCLTLMVLLASVSAITALMLTTITETIHVHGQVGTGIQSIKAAYSVEIVPGAAQKTNLLHYYPARIAVPVGTTVAWFNNDPEQPHTVTSGSFGAPDSGALFNSGVMPALNGVPFQYTFDRAGSVLYHCEIHPWRVGIVSVNAVTDMGTNFEFSSGVGPIWNLTKDSRTLLDFTPLTIALDLSTPITYNITMFKNSITNKVFSKTFSVPGDKLPLELIVGGYANHTRVYGPDFSSSGAYHLQAPFLKGNSNYIMKVEIAAINGKPPQNKLVDGFNLRTIT